MLLIFCAHQQINNLVSLLLFLVQFLAKQEEKVCCCCFCFLFVLFVLFAAWFVGLFCFVLLCCVVLCCSDPSPSYPSFSFSLKKLN